MRWEPPWWWCWGVSEGIDKRDGVYDRVVERIPVVMGYRCLGGRLRSTIAGEE